MHPLSRTLCFKKSFAIFTGIFFASALMVNIAHAGNLTFLKDTPMAKFNDEDMKLMLSNAHAALDDAKIPSLHKWQNVTTGYSGSAETLLSFAGPNGMACKRLRITNQANDRNGKAMYTVCNMDADGWKVVPNDYAPLPKRKSK